jgi:predicted exporter
MNRLTQWLGQLNQGAVRWVTALSVVLFLLAGAASLVLATMRENANAELRTLDQRREALSRENNTIRSEIGEITTLRNMEARARAAGFVPATPAVFVAVTPVR